MEAVNVGIHSIQYVDVFGGTVTMTGGCGTQRYADFARAAQKKSPPSPLINIYNITQMFDG